MPLHRASAPPTSRSSVPSGVQNVGFTHPETGKTKQRSFSDGWFDDFRKGSSTGSSHSSSQPSHHRKSSDASARSITRRPTSPTKNVYTHCGRHTDQFLLGGRSMSDLIRNVFSKKR